MKSFLHNNCLDNVQHISETNIQAKNPLIEKIQSVPHTFLIPFYLIRLVLEWEYMIFFNFQVDEKYYVSYVLYL